MFSKYSTDTINKTGNAIICFALNINNLSKTKLLKLLYLVEEQSVKKYGTPFLEKNMKFGI